MIEGGIGQAVTQRMRARPRHARATRRPRDAAGFDKGSEENALSRRSPVVARRALGDRDVGDGVGGVGDGLVVLHRLGSGLQEPIQLTNMVLVGSGL